MEEDHSSDSSLKTSHESGSVWTASIEDFCILFGGTFNAFAHPIVVWNPRFQVAFVNQSWEQTFHISASEIKGLSVEGYNQLLSQMIADSLNVTRLLNQMRTEARSWQSAMIHILPNPPRKEQYFSCTIHSVPEGILQGFKIESFLDITQKISVQKELHLMQKTLIELQHQQTVGQLAAGIMHDLNNILSIMAGYAQMIQMNPNNASKYVTPICKSCDLMAKILNNAMDFAQIRHKSGNEECNLYQILQELQELIRHAISKRIELYWDLDPTVPPIQGNSAQLCQLILNLCLNAADSIQEKGSISIKLKVVSANEVKGDISSLGNKIHEVTSWIQMSILDTGCGMGEQTANNLFMPFFSKKREPLHRGLGMYVAQQILHFHGGTICVESKKGEGTLVSCYFPVQRP